LGIADETGSLEIGKAADITAVNLGTLETQPLYHPVSHLVYATGRDKVSDVWIAGRHVVNSGELTTLDQNEILLKAVEWNRKIADIDELLEFT
ncbi:MAG: amidohydrolase family protein, partial [Candidatus Sedimenticola sp. 6PFRAG5]